ncbi:hypothetical protein JTB14_013815 [Gonioctena quinquepunctata]|nr:hypothetical protein JTB14_013815 [Gonioctena quinquepunctata]
MADCSRSRPLTQNELEEALYESDISLSDTEDPQYIQPNLRNDHNGASSDSDSSDSEPIERDRPVSEISLSSSLMHRSTRSTRVSRRRRGHRAPIRVRNTSVRSNGTSAQLVNNEGTGNFTPIEKPLFQPRYKKEDCRLWTPEDYFRQYINDEMLEIIVVASNRTYLEKKGSELRLTTKELKVFIGVLTSLKVVYYPEVGDAEKANKIWKVMPLFRSILRGCQAQIRTDNISIDEMIIPFTGHCGIRQFCPRKPNPMGIKIFMLANPNGIVCDMTVYQGDSTFSADLIQQWFTLGESAVISLCDTLDPGHHSYFTTIKLADILLERCFHATEILFVKNPRDTTETKVRGYGIITIHRWLDNKPVTILSTCNAAKNPDQCRRSSKRKKEYEMILLTECWQSSFSITHQNDNPLISHVRFGVCNFGFNMRNSNEKIRQNTFPVTILQIGSGRTVDSDNTLSSDSESSNYGIRTQTWKRKVEIKPIPRSFTLSQG